ncbi:hypothetical protein NF867_08410 [Solitalea sp. MAHUQ-68]|uniref:Lipoprotein n=1 Tax=Solitalea agri TaxID=2953739 RepID=A0A9X2F2E5_9SPHI|nr:hypothetical protein [Solitalea agri]MCO4292880.1 hypothetical protein [Solitalea agri]
MKRYFKIIIALLMIAFLTACSNMTVGVGYGVSYMGGPYGPYGPMVTPTVGVGFYGGHGW